MSRKQHKLPSIRFDMDTYNPENTVTFVLFPNEREDLQGDYNSVVSRLELLTTAGGTTLFSHGVTYEDSVQPICKFRINGSYKGEDVSTTFLLTRETFTLRHFIR